jgi:hypothetical protein
MTMVDQSPEDARRWLVDEGLITLEEAAAATTAGQGAAARAEKVRSDLLALNALRQRRR